MGERNYRLLQRKLLQSEVAVYLKDATNYQLLEEYMERRTAINKILGFINVCSKNKY